jgi:hypothetical protein
MTTKYSITEALAELKTIDKRIASAVEFINKYNIRQGSTIDPLDDEGGSHVVIPQKMQSITDLLERKLAIRTAINKTNAITNVTVCGVTKTIAEWIVWRRECSGKELVALQGFQRGILDARQQCLSKQMTLKDDGTQPSKVTEVSSFIKELPLAKRMDWIREVESTLDGKLSLTNATTLVEV